LGANPLAINVGASSGATTINAVISGSAGKLIVNNASNSAVTLAAANTFQGGVTLNSGQLLLGNSASLGTGPLTINGGTLGASSFSGNLGYPPFSPAFSNNISSNGAGLRMGGPFQYSLTGSISGSAGVTLAPNSLFDGVWTLAGANSFSGPLTVNASPTPGVSDTLLVASPASLGNASTINLNGGSLSRLGFIGGTSTVTINTPAIVGSAGGSVLAYNTITNTQLNYAGSISGSGSLTIFGPGYTTLSGANTFAGSLNLSGGTTIVGDDSNMGAPAGHIVLDSGSLVLAPTFTATNRPVFVKTTGSTLYVTGSSTFNGNISNGLSQNLVKAGAGNLFLTAQNTFNGVLSVSGGTVTATGALGAINNGGSVNILPGAAVVLDNTDGTGPRIGGGAAVNLNGGAIYLIGNATLNSGAISTGPMNLGLANEAGAGYVTISATPGASANARITFNNLPRTGNNGTNALFTGLNLGTALILSATPGTSNISFTSAPGLTNGILPWAIADATGGPGTDLANYAAGIGIRPLPVGSYSTSINAGSITSNVMIDNAVAPSGASMNALKMTGGTVDATAGMQIGAGALLVTGASTITGGSITIGTSTTNTTTAPTFNVFTIADLNLASRITNFTPAAGLPSGLAKAGPGVLTLSVSNSYSGPTFIHAGTLKLGISTGIPTTSEVFVNPGATFDLNGNNGTIGSLNQTAASFSTGNNLYGTVNIGSMTLTSGVDNNSTTYNGEILGNGNFVKRGTGTLTLIGAKAFTGTMTIGNGAVVLGTHITSGTAMSNATRINIGSASLDADTMLAIGFGLNNFSVPIATAAPAGRTATLQFIDSPAGTAGTSLASPITLGTRGIIIDSDGATTIAGQISGAGSLTTRTSSVLLAGGPASFSLNITAANTYTGATLLTANATLFGSSTAFGNSTTPVGLGSTSGPDTPELSSSLALTLTRNITVNDSLNAVPTFAIIGSRAPSNAGTTFYLGTISIPGQRRTAILYSQNPGSPVSFTGVISGGPLASVQVGHSLGSGQEFINSNVTLTGANTFAGGARLLTGTLNLGTSSVSNGSTILSGPVGTGTLTIGSADIVGAAEPTLIAAGGARNLDNPVVLSSNFAMRGGNTLTFTGSVDLGGAPRVITVETIVPSASFQLAGAVTGAPGSALIKSGSGTLQLSGTNTYSGPTVVMEGTLLFNAKETLAGMLGVGPGAAAVVGAHGAHTITTPAVSIDAANGGKLDMKDNELIVDYSGASPISSIVALIQAGYSGGAWTGNGITSASAAAAASGAMKTALGVAEATDVFSTFPASFAGQSVDNTSVLVRYTAYGDATLDGTVDTTDFNILAANFGTSGRRWSQGDFNYDGNVDTIDFNQLASNFGASVPASALSSSPGVLVPEPAYIAVFAGVGLLGRRRRRRA
jgi:autotransporter-associated beta strand protein